MEKKKDSFIIARVPTELKDKLVREAKDNGITISKMFRKILEERLK